MLDICCAYANFKQVTMVRCPLNSDTEPWHQALPIPKLTARINIEYFKALIKNGYQERKAVCTYIGHVTERRKMCSTF
jgi:hypothetical protein